MAKSQRSFILEFEFTDGSGRIEIHKASMTKIRQAAVEALRSNESCRAVYISEILHSTRRGKLLKMPGLKGKVSIVEFKDIGL